MRAIQISIEEHEVLDILTGRQALALPPGARLRSFFRWTRQDEETGIHSDVWYASVEHDSFPEVKLRIPRMTAQEFAARYPARKQPLREGHPKLLAAGGRI